MAFFLRMKNNQILEFDNEHIATMLGMALIGTHGYTV